MWEWERDKGSVRIHKGYIMAGYLCGQRELNPTGEPWEAVLSMPQSNLPQVGRTHGYLSSSSHHAGLSGGPKYIKLYPSRSI